MKFHWAKSCEYPDSPPERSFYGFEIWNHIIGFMRFNGGFSFTISELVG